MRSTMRQQWLIEKETNRESKKDRKDRGSLPFEQNGPKEDIDDLRVVVRICPL